MKMTEGLFDEVFNYPDPEARERYDDLVGLDDIKDRLEKEAEILIRPDLLDQWSKKFHTAKSPVLTMLHRRPPLFVFAGDVGTGKTELGITCGDMLAKKIKLPIELYSLSLTTRGTGAVGEMTRLISEAFKHVKSRTSRLKLAGKKITGATILLIDEADSLAQSRELAQMHHEDRAGVNALIRGIDDLAREKLPCVTIMCTNRLAALDPAIRRRAAATFIFARPNLALRKHLLQKFLSDFGLTDSQITSLAEKTGDRQERPYGYTYSDITQRFMPSLVLAAYPNSAITFELAESVIDSIPPTAPFSAE
jgi:AAA+ superfamily predicted ATPase